MYYIVSSSVSWMQEFSVTEQQWSVRVYFCLLTLPATSCSDIIIYHKEEKLLSSQSVWHNNLLLWQKDEMHWLQQTSLAGLTAPVSQDLDGHIALCEAKMVRDGVVNIIIISTSYSKHHPHIFYDQTNHNRGDSGG